MVDCLYCGKPHGPFSTSEPSCEAEIWLANYGQVKNQMDICLTVSVGMVLLGIFNIIPGFMVLGIIGTLVSGLGSYLLHKEFSEIANRVKGAK